MTALKQRSAYAAAAHVLRAPTLSWVVDGKLNDESEFILWEEILDRYNALSSGEQALVDLAQALWRDIGEYPLDLRNFDDATWQRVVEAFLALRPIPTIQRSSAVVAEEAIGLFLDRANNAGIYLSTALDTDHQPEVDDLNEVRSEVVQEIREGFAVREDEIR